MLPRGVIRDIVTSVLPHWEDTRAWILARPLSGFAETFAQYIVEVAPGGGSDAPEPDPRAQGVLFVEVRLLKVEGEDVSGCSVKQVVAMFKSKPRPIATVWSF